MAISDTLSHTLAHAQFEIEKYLGTGRFDDRSEPSLKEIEDLLKHMAQLVCKKLREKRSQILNAYRQTTPCFGNRWLGAWTIPLADVPSVLVRY